MLRLFALGPLLLALQCQEPVLLVSDLDPYRERSHGVTLTTDSLAYTAEYTRGDGTYRRYAFRIVARFRNHTREEVNLALCGFDWPTPIWSVDVSGANEIGVPLSGYEQHWACPGHPRYHVLPPGGARIDTLMVEGPTAWDGRTGEVSGLMEGFFRLAYAGGYLSPEFQIVLSD